MPERRLSSRRKWQIGKHRLSQTALMEHPLRRGVSAGARSFTSDSDAGPARTIVTEAEHNEFNAVVLSTVSTPATDSVLGEDASGLAIRVELKYAANEDAWILNHLSEIVQRDQDGNIIAAERLYYDGEPFVVCRRDS